MEKSDRNMEKFGIVSTKNVSLIAILLLIITGCCKPKSNKEKAIVFYVWAYHDRYPKAKDNPQWKRIKERRIEREVRAYFQLINQSESSVFLPIRYKDIFGGQHSCILTSINGLNSEPHTSYFSGFYDNVVFSDSVTLQPKDTLWVTVSLNYGNLIDMDACNMSLQQIANNIKFEYWSPSTAQMRAESKMPPIIFRRFDPIKFSWGKQW